MLRRVFCEEGNFSRNQKLVMGKSRKKRGSGKGPASAKTGEYYLRFVGSLSCMPRSSEITLHVMFDVFVTAPAVIKANLTGS